MLNIFTLPGAQSIVDGASDYGSIWFAQFLPTLYVVVGLSAAVGVVFLIARAISSGISHLSHPDDFESEASSLLSSARQRDRTTRMLDEAWRLRMKN